MAENSFYRIRFRLWSPMQIGAGTHGMVEKSLLYVPGRVLWAALTKAIAEELFDDYAGRHYVDAGKALGGNNSSLFSTLFLSFDGETPIVPVAGDPPKDAVVVHNDDAEDTHSPLWWYENGGEHRCWSDAGFRSIVLSSEAAQSTAPDRMATKQNSLHEIMLIQPNVKIEPDADVTPMCLVGMLQLPDPLIINGQQVSVDWLEKQAFNRIRFGGGRTRGRGRVTFIKLEKIESPEAAQLANPPGVLLKATPLDEQPTVSGRAFRAAYREWENGEQKNRGPGHAVSHAGLRWEIGSRIESEAE